MVAQLVTQDDGRPNKDMNLTSSAWQTEALLASYVQRSTDTAAMGAPPKKEDVL